MATLILSVWATAVSAETVVISEIMYHPPANEPEYVEIYNVTATPRDMAKWRFTEGVDYTFPEFNAEDPQRTFLGPFERIVVSSADEAATRAAYLIPMTVRVYGPWRGQLSDAGERIVLEDKNGAGVCAVGYNDRGRWPIAADGAGHSLVLKNVNRVVDDWRNWTVSSRRLGTPGGVPFGEAEVRIPDPELDLSAGVPVVDYATIWRYEASGTNLGSAWREPSYDDSDWLSGPGLIGFENASLPAPGLQTRFTSNGRLTYYVRTKFPYSGDVSGTRIRIDQIVDDGAVYYLNGIEIGRVGVGAGTMGFGTAANRTVGDAVEERDVIEVAGTALRSGENVLAVEVHQVNTTSSDLVFGARLRVSTPSRSGLRINEVLAGASGFVELFNPTAAAIALQGYFLTDDPRNLRKFPITTSLDVAPNSLRSVPFSGITATPNSPTSVYLVASDGATIVHAMRTALPQDGRSVGVRPDGSGEWYIFSEPSRDLPNSSDEEQSAIRINEVQFTGAKLIEWVELYNSSERAISLDGLFVSSKRDFSDKVSLSGVLSAKSWTSLNVQFGGAGDDVRLYLGNARGRVLDAHRFEFPDTTESVQAFPDGTGEWYSAASATRDAPNNSARTTGIVINEIMCDSPSGEPDGEFVELYNRSATAIDISGWRFVDGIQFTFPADTIFPAGAYVVVAANAERMRRVYGDILVAGSFEGRLSNRGEVIRLVDARGNLADEVDYKMGGDWPDRVNGGGSSLELVNPWVDNSLASGWRQSDESTKSQFREYVYRDVFRQLTTFGSTRDYKELHLHLVGDSHVVLRDIELVKLGGDGSNLIVNVDQMSTNGVSASGWLAQGTHWASHIENGEFHIISDGRGDNRPNRCEIDLPELLRNDACELRFKARWVSGNPRLIAQTWDHSIAESFRIDVPTNLGTPGARNSRASADPVPQIDGLLHSPAVPRSNQSVRITAQVRSYSPLKQVQLVHRADNSNASASWSTKLMFDDGTNGDRVAGDGIYTATLTEHRVSGRIVQFYMRAEAVTGQSYTLPKHGVEKPAMYVVDDRNVPKDLRTARFIVSAYDLGAISNGGTSKYDYKFPRLQNHYFNMTFISNEEEIFYGGEIRNSGSPWTRGGDLSRGKWKLPDDRRFRGHYKFTYDNDAGGGQLTHNRVTRHMLYLMGHHVNDNEFIRVMINSGTPELREDTEAIDNDFLNRLWPEGSSGDLYRIDDEWWFTDSWQRQSRNADWRYKGTENAGRYRTEWMKRTNEEADDFTALINFFKTVSGSYSEAQINRLIDPHATLIMAVVRGYISDWDSFSLSRGKNGWFYRRPTDGLFQFLHWDSDLAFGDASGPLFSGVPGFGPWLTKPYNRRIFYSYLVELLENYTQNSPRMEAWLQAEESASTAYSARTSFYRSWFNNRRAACLRAMGANYTRAFEITTNNGEPVETNGDSISLSGFSPYGVLALRVEGHPEAEFVWNNEVAWSVSGVRLRKGENRLTVSGLDQWGNVLKQDVVEVRKTTDAAPVIELTATPRSWHVEWGRSIELDARASFDPEGSPVTFTWSTTAAQGFGIFLTTNSVGRAEAVFDRPGLYEVTVGVTDSSGTFAQMVREASVFAPGDFSSFSGFALDALWRLENVDYRANTSSGAWLSLTENPGHLIVQVGGEEAKPLQSSGEQYPYVWRLLPASGDWVLETDVWLDSRQFGSFLTGLLIETLEGGTTNRYSFGLDGGNLVSVKRVSATSAALGAEVAGIDTQPGMPSLLQAVPNASSGAVLRVRRAGDDLFFERKVDDVWSVIHSVGIGASATALRGGLFIATTNEEAIKVGFDYALLVDPSQTSELRQNLRLAEIMYNPVGGDDFEFVELMNVGNSGIELAGARFTNGISYTFGELRLPPGERIVVVKNQTAFMSRYGGAVQIASGEYSGRLDNGGETLTLVDKNNDLVFSIRYDDEGEWPVRADGAGSSLEVIEPRGNLGSPENWRSSEEYHGSPGRAGSGSIDTDNDGMTDAWELANGFDPNSKADASLDTDGDGLTNLGEFLAGTDPRDASSALRLQFVGESGSGVVIGFTAVRDRSYSVYFRDSLTTGSWNKLMDVPAEGADRRYRFEDSFEGHAHRFYRVVTPAQP